MIKTPWGEANTIQGKKIRENNISIHYSVKDLKPDKEWLEFWHWYTLGQLTYRILFFSPLIDKHQCPSRAIVGIQ